MGFLGQFGILVATAALAAAAPAQPVPRGMREREREPVLTIPDEAKLLVQTFRQRRWAS